MADIKDSEIRFIGETEPFDSKAELLKHQQRESDERPSAKQYVSVYSSSPSSGSRSGCRKIVLLIGVILMLLGVIGVGTIRSCAEGKSKPKMSNIEDDDVINAEFEPEQVEVQFEAVPTQAHFGMLDELLTAENTDASYCQIKNGSVNDIPFRIFRPLNAVPDLHIGKIDQRDKSIILALQAADVRRDNGKIVGACVNNGEVISKGIAKKGFVAIIDGNITVGVSEHSPLFEEAIEKDGDFFRQYPIVSNGAIVENNPKNISIRRAICERNGLCFVVETLVPVSFHDFSQMLVDLEVNNAVYLVGSQYACGFSRNEEHELQKWGEMKYSRAKNVSYLVWRVK